MKCDSRDTFFVSYPGVLSTLLNLKTKTSCVPDGITNVFLRRYAEHIEKFLVVIFRSSLLSSKIPSDWKAARVTPVFIKGNRLSPLNYRPISITFSCCKLIEHIIANQLAIFTVKTQSYPISNMALERDIRQLHN